MEPISTSEAIAAFLSSKKGRWSDKTFEWYNLTFAPFAAQFKILPLEPEPIEEFIAFPESDHLRWTRFRSLRTLYIWLKKRRDLPNPFDKIDPLSENLKPVIPLDDAEIERILALDLSPQDEALVHALLTTGIRPGELRNLKPESIMEETIILNGKTGIDRMPIKAEVRDLLLKVSGQSYVFEDQDGTLLSKEQVYRIVENIMLRAGVREGKGGARLFRHTFITRVYGKTGDPFLVQRLARHASLTMTRHYEHAALDDTIKKYKELDFIPGKRKREATKAYSPFITKDTPPFEPPCRWCKFGDDCSREFFYALEGGGLVCDKGQGIIPGHAGEKTAGVGDKAQGEAEEPFAEEGAVQIPFGIPPDAEAPTPPYIIREYAYCLHPQGDQGDQRYRMKGWRIIGSNGAFWPATDQPKNFLSFEEATKKVVELSP